MHGNHESWQDTFWKLLTNPGVELVATIAVVMVATWYLIDKSPYMVYGEVPLPNGQVQHMSEVAIPMSGGK